METERGDGQGPFHPERRGEHLGVTPPPPSDPRNVVPANPRRFGHNARGKTSESSLYRIGEVNTPLDWAVWAAERYGLVDRWLSGATVLDPTMGEGNLLEAFLSAATRRGRQPTSLPAGNLYGVERQEEKITAFLQRVKERYGLEVPPRNYVGMDILTEGACEWVGIEGGEGWPPRVDILFGNPPWVSFVDLPDSYKNRVKDLFLRYSLVRNRGQVLMGKSRVNLAALILLCSLDRWLKPGGEGVFFLPLSLFFGEGAGEGFRRFRIGDTPFAVRELVDLSFHRVFPDVATRYGIAWLKRDEEQRFPVPVCRLKKGPPPSGEQSVSTLEGGTGENPAAMVLEKEWRAVPISGTGSPWILRQGELPVAFELPSIPVPRGTKPRQGVNTCGANDLFFFKAVMPQTDEVWEVSNGFISTLLPRRYLYPLLTSDSFRQDDPIPRKWVFLPYRRDGRPLAPEEIERDPYLRAFLVQNQERLSGRKGVLIQQWIRKGYYWALWGVGPYSFCPWKIVWESAGRRSFVPRLFSGEWQANQSLQVYLAFQRKDTALRALEQLRDPRVELYLTSLQAGGSLNWAQPGRMKRLFREEDVE